MQNLASFQQLALYGAPPMSGIYGNNQPRGGIYNFPPPPFPPRISNAPRAPLNANAREFVPRNGQGPRRDQPGLEQVPSNIYNAPSNYNGYNGFWSG
jgi:hypothetical protein